MMKPALGAIIFICILFLSMSLESFGQPIRDYKKEWKMVSDLVAKGRPQSALAEVKKIYALAKKEKQDAQVIKSLVYITDLQQQLRENAELFSVAEIEKEIKASKEPATSILNSLLAAKYWNYFESNRWQFRDRSETAGFKKDDLSTWSAGDFYNKVTELHELSLKNSALLQKTPLPAFDAIIDKGNMRHLRPTLYDLLAHRALDFFKRDEFDLSKPSYAFEIDQASAFEPAASFVRQSFPTRDSASLLRKAILVFQKLIAFHLDDPKPGALIDVDLERILFIKQESVHPEKDQLYSGAISHVANQYGQLPAASQAWFLLAKYYEEKASRYQPFGDTTHRYDRVKAKDICEAVLAQKDSSEGRVNCFNLLNQITRKELSFQVEHVNVPGQPFRSIISYRNFNHLYLRVIKMSESLKKARENLADDRYWSLLFSTAALRSWEQPLPAMRDLQNHRVEIKIDALPVGEYLLVASSEKYLAKKATVAGVASLYVSNISYVNNADDFFVLHRESGQPLDGALVQVWRQKYDYKTSTWGREKLRQYKTDAHGHFTMNERSESERYQGYFLEIDHKDDHLFLDEQTYYYNSPQPGRLAADLEQRTYTYFFTDRSIYRPGQVAYFKGISILTDGDKKSPRAEYKTRVFLYDANHQKIDSVAVETNEYGSFSGKFQLPQGTLNGAFTIQVQSMRGAASIRVEEYKRPKFYVEYEPMTGTYKVNDRVRVTGLAKAYAGNNIDGATVRYRVVRQPRFIYPWLFRRSWLPPGEPMEIAHGELKTDADGKFIIEFTAIPDRSIDKKFEPVFDYEVHADVTDINGETRSGEKTVSVSYKALLLDVAVDARIPVDSLKQLSIRTENMNGRYEPAAVTVTITRLQEEKRLIRARLWERPDQFVMTREEFIRNFPHDEYDNETDQTSWPKGAVAFEKTDSSRESGKWPLAGNKLAAGFYLIEISAKDSNGEVTKDQRFVELFDEKAAKLRRPEYLWSENAGPVEPGETAKLMLATSAEDVFLVSLTDKRKTGEKAERQFSFTRLNDEKRGFDFAVREEDRGGFGVSFIFVKHNRFHQHGETVSVPWTNRELTVEYASYRDNVLPGSEEKWTVKLKGHQNEKVAAEMLAGMYDASLDQFSPHAWSKPGIWPSYRPTGHWSANQNFVPVNSISHHGGGEEHKALDKRYDHFIFDNYYRIFEHDLKGVNVQYLSLGNRNAAPMLEGAVSGIGVADSAIIAPPAPIDGDADGVFDFSVSQPAAPEGAVQIRKNFNETAFFFPDLRTDSSGTIEFSFTMPEALTRWKFQALAHTKDLAFGYSSKEIVTQKQLMVQPNAPRFVRQGDKLEFSSKVVNLTEQEISGQVELQLFDATSNEPVNDLFKHKDLSRTFTVAAGQSMAVTYPIEIPVQFANALTWKIVARSGNISDGEENSMPVLSNRLLVTESLPVYVRGSGTKEFNFGKLLQSGDSKTLQHQSLTVEYSSNPAWYAVQALPYLMEYPYECAEQNWNRYYANSLATMIANSSPRIRQVFENWKTQDSSALLSNLQKNEELKGILLEETPWVLQAKTEAEQKKNIALLFDMVKMSNELNGSFEKLKQMQSENGGFVWFKGGPDDRFITQYIITGIGHLRKLGAIAKGQEDKLGAVLDLAIPYLDRKIRSDYDELVKSKTDLKKYRPGTYVIQYLYMRSFFPDRRIPAATRTAYDYFRGRAQATWTSQGKYMQGMLALALHRAGDVKTPKAILVSLKETSINSEELGMYWKDAGRSWWWYEAPVERQALLIEAFLEISKDAKTADDLRTWLLRNKQTNSWESTKATAEACYALLLQSTQWLATEPLVTIQLGDRTISSPDQKAESGTGYFKQALSSEQVKPEMGNIKVTVEPAPGADRTSTASSWGAVYWQYFEDLDKITTAATPLKLDKKLFVETNTDRGPVLSPVKEGDVLKIGDKIKVRIELRVDRDMEYVHMKDMRASAMEPVNVLSGYKWQDGLGYYETTKDASTNFFFGSLRKGTYVFEYPLFVTHSGNFSNGITTIQCMYAPEFRSHSEGVRIMVK